MLTRILFDKAGEGGGGASGGGSTGGGGAAGGQSGSGANGGGDGKSGGKSGDSSGASGSGGAADKLFGNDGGSSGGSAGSGDGKGGKSGGDGGNAADGKAGGDSGTVVFPTNWKDALPAEIKDAAFMKQIEDVPTLAKNYANAQKMIGADKVPIPGKHATTEEWKETFHKLGNPRTLDEYKFDMDKDTEAGVDKAFAEKFRATAHDLGILPNQAGKLVKWFADLNKEAWTNTAKDHEQKLIDGMKSLEREWGNGYDGNLTRAKAALTEFADKDTADFLRSMGLGKDARFLKFMSKVGESLSEDKLRGAAGGSFKGGLTTTQALEKIAEIKSSPKHPYWNANHENHQSAKKEMETLMGSAYPEEQRRA